MKTNNVKLRRSKDKGKMTRAKKRGSGVNLPHDSRSGMREPDSLGLADELLREREVKFRLLAETIQDVFWICTPAIARIIYVSPAYETLWGRTCESLYREPQSFTEPIHPEDQVRVFATLQEHAQEKWEIEYRIIRPDGSVRWIQDRGFPVRDGRGELVQMCGVATDITQRKLEEEALHRLLANLLRVEEKESRRIVRELHDSTGQTLDALASAAPADRLTPREREVVQLIAEGRTSKDVARQLGLCVKTADAHRANIMHKLDLHSVSELVLYAVRSRIVQA